MPLDSDVCYRAAVARDARFDGVFFIGVRTTGIYCRPVCRARTPGRDRCVFYSHAAEAEHDGFRACFRCRPERAPGSGSDSFVSRTVGAAVSRIQEGALNDDNVDALAAELGVTARHLRRCTEAELGVSPIELALTRKLALARELLHTSSLSMIDIAFASGFRSVRRFNDAFRARHGRTPSELQRQAKGDVGGSPVRLTLDYRPPYDWSSIFAFLGARAILGVEAVTGDAYLSTVRLGERRGWIVVRPASGQALSLEVSPSLLPDLMTVVAKVRRVFDLDARPDLIDAHLAKHPLLAPLVKQRPGLRVPGAFDAFELAMRAVLGQQVTLRGGLTLATRLVDAMGEPFETPFPELHRLWPTAQRVARAREETIAKLGMPGARARTLIAVAKAIANGSVDIDHPSSPVALEESLLALPGIGPWTAQYIVMRAAAWPDAFLESDVAIKKAAGGVTTDACRQLSEAWRPWRSYATLHLWMSLTGEKP